MHSQAMAPFRIDPALLNSANPWATTEEDLRALITCPFTGAITIRTSLLEGFPHDDTVHQYCFFKTDTVEIYQSEGNSSKDHVKSTSENVSSLNSLGYSPVSLPAYVSMIQTLQADIRVECPQQLSKPIIFSVTGSVPEVAQCYASLYLESRKNPDVTWMMEVNLSCPNIDGKPPPAYSQPDLTSYLRMLAEIRPRSNPLHVGIKTPPYTYQGQFDNLMSALSATVENQGVCPVSFITATNTLGTCLVMDASSACPAISSANASGIGGLAGAALHPLALGNVRTIRRMLDEYPGLRHIQIIGVGGVSDGAGYKRMRNVGASAVAVGTALGMYGVGVFEKISGEAKDFTN